MDPFMSSWRDVYSIAVKWRQVSEPGDSVVWVDKLSKEFAAGFGSHTPMVLGQSQVVRYYPNSERAFKIVKELRHERGSVNDAANRPVDMKDPGKLKAALHLHHYQTLLLNHQLLPLALTLCRLCSPPSSWL